MRYFKCVLFFQLMVAAQPLFAATTGQIINVNQSYQIAFTDIGSPMLKPGEVVKVFVSSDEFVYMQVLESSPILSKLGPVQSENYKTNYKDLLRVAVSNPVVKVGSAAEEKTSAMAKPPAVDASAAAAVVNTPAPAVDTAEIVRLEGELKDAKQEIGRLTDANKALQAQVNDLSAQAAQAKQNAMTSPVLSQVKERLENMNRIMNQD